MEVRFVIEQGKTRTRTLVLRKDEGIVGRERGCDLRIASAEVSRRHCVLRVRDGYVTVEDMRSANGTHLNGEPVTGRAVVRPGDRLKVGPVTFVVEYQLTPEAIDRLLQGEEAVSDLEVVEEGLQEVTPAEDDEPVDDLELIDAGNFQLPETDELRDILTGLDEDEAPAPKKGKKKK
jgi:pSer/pThr/pTyr-binding forkhead associated (FHA) protein